MPFATSVPSISNIQAGIGFIPQLSGKELVPFIVLSFR